MICLQSTNKTRWRSSVSPSGCKNIIKYFWQITWISAITSLQLFDWLFAGYQTMLFSRTIEINSSVTNSDIGRVNAAKSITFQTCIETILQSHFFLSNPALRYLKMKINNFYLYSITICIFVRLYSLKKISNFLDNIIICIHTKLVKIRKRFRKKVHPES